MLWMSLYLDFGSLEIWKKQTCIKVNNWGTSERSLISNGRFYWIWYQQSSNGTGKTFACNARSLVSKSLILRVYCTQIVSLPHLAFQCVADCNQANTLNKIAKHIWLILTLSKVCWIMAVFGASFLAFGAVLDWHLAMSFQPKKLSIVITVPILWSSFNSIDVTIAIAQH